jgi:hypothetical protein
MLAISTGLCRHVLCLDSSQPTEHDSRPWLDAASAAATAYLRRHRLDQEIFHAITRSARLGAESRAEPALVRADQIGSTATGTTAPPPFTTSDIAIPHRRATALVLSSVDTIDSNSRPVVTVDAVGTRQPASHSAESYLPTARTCVEQLWQRSSLTIQQIGLVLLDDRCSFDVIAGLELLDLCAPGQAHRLIIPDRPNQEFLVNPSGGQLGGYYAGGYDQLHEATYHLRNASVTRPDPTPAAALILSNNSAGSSVALTVRRSHI